MIPALTSFLATFLTGISQYEKDPDLTSYPWLDTLNTFVGFMESHYKPLFLKLFPRKRKPPPKSSHSSTVNGEESDSDSCSNSSSGSEADSQSSESLSEEGSSHKKKKHKKSHKKKKSKKKSKKREKKRKVQSSQQTHIKVGCKVVLSRLEDVVCCKLRKLSRSSLGIRTGYCSQTECFEG